jgi:hypothetical protein
MWGRATAGILPGFLLSAGVVGLICWGLPGGWEETVVPGLIAFFPLWMGMIGASFMFASGKRAWLVLGALALLSLGALWALQALQWVR